MLSIKDSPSFRAQLKDFERLAAEENNWRRERMEFERSNAMTKHDHKEVSICPLIVIYPV